MSTSAPVAHPDPRVAAAERYRGSVADVAGVLELTADACQAPMAALKLLGGRSAHFTATFGLRHVAEVPKAVSLCDLVCSTDHAVVVTDAARDPRLAAHPLVAGESHVKFVGAAPLHHDGHVVGALCVFDNHRRRMSAATTRRLLERLASRVDAETGVRDRLVRQPFPLTPDQDEIVSTVSHELRTPLTVIRGNLELLVSMGAIAPEFARQADAVTRNAERLTRTVDTLLRAAGQKAPGPAARPVLADLREIVSAAAAALGERAADVRVRVPATPVRVLADELLLELATGHLLSNALSHGGPDPVAVTVTGTPQPTVEIVDHGSGLGEAELGRLGTPFFRGERARRDQVPGLGLGLAVTRRIVEAQGGALHVGSPTGGGVTARIVLPAAVIEPPASI